MAVDLFRYKVKLRKRAKKLYPQDKRKQNQFVDGVLKIANLKSNNPKESRDMVAQAFTKHG